MFIYYVQITVLFTDRNRNGVAYYVEKILIVVKLMG